MEAYAQALLIAIPGFLGLILLEIGYGHWRGKQTYTFMDTLASLSSGVTNIIKDSLGLAIVLVSYPLLVDQLAVITLEENLWVYLIAFVCIDFAAYWGHRLNHHINIFWNQHLVHHSSEEFNLACALRQSISNVIGFNALFLIPAALVGVPATVINILAPIHLFGQFWYHTQHIGKLGWLEYVLVTPSQHRVHHAINAIYLDKNLSAIFCVWDRWFGTFQEELDEVPPVYGTLKPSHSWNPFVINFQHLWGLLKDAWHTQHWKDKIKIWWMPTGWRPQDVADRFPRPLTEANDQTKYNPPANTFLKVWALFQFVGTAYILLSLFALFGKLSYATLCQWGVLLFVGIFTYTAVMDRKSYGNFLLAIYPLLGLLYLVGIATTMAEEQPVLYYGTMIFLGLSWLSGMAMGTFSIITKPLDGSPA